MEEHIRTCCDILRAPRNDARCWCLVQPSTDSVHQLKRSIMLDDRLTSGLCQVPTGRAIHELTVKLAEPRRHMQCIRLSRGLRRIPLGRNIRRGSFGETRLAMSFAQQQKQLTRMHRLPTDRVPRIASPNSQGTMSGRCPLAETIQACPRRATRRWLVDSLRGWRRRVSLPSCKLSN